MGETRWVVYGLEWSRSFVSLGLGVCQGLVYPESCKGLGLYVVRKSHAMCRRGNILKARRGKSRESMAHFWEQMPVPLETR
ncbi:hypothetical protein J1N35_031706 [Gossypium stocksii]|uniref:Uncharacterized protein n=1 Tax=Gossypium stocksii TaxID=47602 RepID=A0A9D3V328_9ROSI|nr:hypothetical protein J1N35_031706 [Gossypium stocksii]